MTGTVASARKASNSSAMSALARLGLTARAFVYLVIGWLAFQIALGHRTHQANQKGALADIAQRPFGVALLWLLGVGFAAYALWRLSEALFGSSSDGSGAGARIQSVVRSVAYFALAATTFAFIAGRSRQGQAQQQATATAKLMRHGYGRWLVAIAGLVVVAVGVGMVVEGVTRKFEKQLRTNELSGATREVVVGLGLVGTVARGIVFAVAGALAVDAAATFEADKSTGLDGALRTLAGHPYGRWLLGAVAVGLIAFGVYGFAAARWAKT